MPCACHSATGSSRNPGPRSLMSVRRWSTSTGQSLGLRSLIFRSCLICTDVLAVRVRRLPAAAASARRVDGTGSSGISRPHSRCCRSWQSVMPSTPASRASRFATNHRGKFQPKPLSRITRRLWTSYARQEWTHGGLLWCCQCSSARKVRRTSSKHGPSSRKEDIATCASMCTATTVSRTSSMARLLRSSFEPWRPTPRCSSSIPWLQESGPWVLAKPPGAPVAIWMRTAS
mmetsp:Transcript_52138/g.124731  ORF Transcript_52138/g.124731 Transcript_52138/m.124731 type:complete len:231 (+) Transcript_52138:282-974(+)